MSVAQVKKRFGEMESYLGRDKEALRRLKLLKDDVNVLRTSLAAAEEKAEQAEIVKNAARDRADKAETEAEELRRENQRLAARLLSAEASITSVTREESPEEDPEDHNMSSDSKGLKATVKWLRKSSDITKCPKPFAGKLGNFTYDRDELASGWSYRSLYTLGAAVAAIAAFNGKVTIRVDRPFKDYPKEEKTDGLIKAYILWTERLIDKSTDERSFAEKLSEEMTDAFLGLKD